MPQMKRTCCETTIHNRAVVYSQSAVDSGEHFAQAKLC